MKKDEIAALTDRKNSLRTYNVNTTEAESIVWYFELLARSPVEVSEFESRLSGLGERFTDVSIDPTNAGMRLRASRSPWLATSSVRSDAVLR